MTSPLAANRPAPIAKPEKLWGAPAIAQALGVSVDTVYRLAKEGDVPIFRPSGRYFAKRAELDTWLRTKGCGAIVQSP